MRHLATVLLSLCALGTAAGLASGPGRRRPLERRRPTARAGSARAFSGCRARRRRCSRRRQRPQPRPPRDATGWSRPRGDSRRWRPRHSSRHRCATIFGGRHLSLGRPPQPFDAAPFLALLGRARTALEGGLGLGLGFQGSYSQTKVQEPVYGGHASAMGPPPDRPPTAPGASAGQASPAPFEEVPCLPARTWCGGKTKDHILESGGTGVALFDYDGDGRLDVFLVNAYELTASTRERVAPSARALPQPRRLEVRGRVAPGRHRRRRVGQRRLRRRRRRRRAASTST